MPLLLEVVGCPRACLSVNKVVRVMRALESGGGPFDGPATSDEESLRAPRGLLKFIMPSNPLKPPTPRTHHDHAHRHHKHLDTAVMCLLVGMHRRAAVVCSTSPPSSCCSLPLCLHQKQLDTNALSTHPTLHRTHNATPHASGRWPWPSWARRWRFPWWAR